jgi:nifR3 family TIM-barrel protein
MVELGKVKIEGDIALSPMAGISDSPFRKIVRKFGSAFSYTEFVNTEQIVRNNQKSIDMFRFETVERPITFQIFGSNPETVIDSSRIISELKPDMIDLNMGCSVSKVAHHGSGAGLLKKLNVVGKMIEGMVKSNDCPITAKIRIGWDENNLNYKETVRVLEGSGVSAISVHGRTKAMGYQGIADWNVIGEIKSFAKVPIFGNGDVQSYSEALRRKKETNVDLVLIGRKAIGNPWIFSETPKEKRTWEEIRVVILEHLKDILKFYPSEDEYGLILFRKHFVRYIDGISFPGQLKQKLLQTKSARQFEDILLSTNLYFDMQLTEISESEIHCEMFK